MGNLLNLNILLNTEKGFKNQSVIDAGMSFNIFLYDTYGVIADDELKKLFDLSGIKILGENPDIVILQQKNKIFKADVYRDVFKYMQDKNTVIRKVGFCPAINFESMKLLNKTESNPEAIQIFSNKEIVTIYINQRKIDGYNDLLDSENIKFVDRHLLHDSVIETFTAVFRNGVKADIKVCAGENNCFIDPVLFKDGSEVKTLEVGDMLSGPYEFEYNNKKYIVNIKSSDLKEVCK